MKYRILYTGQFKRSYKRCQKRGLPMDTLEKVVTLLAQNGSLPSSYRPHKLSSDYANCWECHIEPDWLLVWKQDDSELTLLLLQTGTHADIF